MNPSLFTLPGQGVILMPGYEQAQWVVDMREFQNSWGIEISITGRGHVSSFKYDFRGRGLKLRGDLLAQCRQHRWGQRKIPSLEGRLDTLRPFSCDTQDGVICLRDGDRCAKCDILAPPDIEQLVREGSVIDECSPDPFLFFNDFHPKLERTRCCKSYVCSECLARHILQCIHYCWSRKLDGDPEESSWLSCPICDDGMSPLYSKCHNVFVLLQALEVFSLNENVRHFLKFRHATKLRECLVQNPRAGQPSWGVYQMLAERSMAMHESLAGVGLIKPFFSILEELGGCANLQPSCLPLVLNGKADRNDIVLPVFAELFASWRECRLCCERYHDYHHVDEARCVSIFKKLGYGIKFPEAQFPSPEELPGCCHVQEVCRKCLATHLQAEIQPHAYGCVEKISCPDQRCQRIFTIDDIRHIAPTVVADMYDRLVMFTNLPAAMKERFMWCMADDCDSGSVYSVVSVAPLFGLHKGRVRCPDCKFAMCFRHQIPWHEGMTCAEYDTAHGESEQATKEWLEASTKSCPGEGCGANTIKGNGCWHITCQICRHEYCWECLAEYRSILRDRRNHKEGCFFREEGSLLPSQVRGNDRERVQRDVERTRGLTPNEAWDVIDAEDEQGSEDGYEGEDLDEYMDDDEDQDAEGGEEDIDEDDD